MGTVIVSIILFAAFGYALYRSIKNHKNGSCSGCSGCSKKDDCNCQ